MENNNEKTAEEIISIAVDVMNLLAEKNCTIDEAERVLNSAKLSISHVTKVQKLRWQPENKKDNV